MAGIEIRNIKKTYMVDENQVRVLKGLSLSIPTGEITVVLGRSGCGKTTLLRLVGDLEPVDEGEIIFETEHRTGFVFQEPRLMPWLDVKKNITFGLAKEEINQREIEDIIRTVNLQGFEKAFPNQLSGGMQQRVSIGRALAIKPSFLLMDEPFAALDYFTREMMQKELLHLYGEKNVSILFVTHSIDEAIRIANRVVIIEDGVVKRKIEIPGYQMERDLMEDAYINLKREILHELGEFGVHFSE